MSSVKLHSPYPSPAFPNVEAGITPPLPQIQSQQIHKRVFTHRSVAAGHRYDFQAPEDDPSTDNEELGHIGDQVFSLAVTDLIQQLHPYLRIGPTAKMRDYVKCKLLLAEICVSYGLHNRLNISKRQAITIRTSSNVQADTFKAYVGGLYRDQGMEVVSKWLTSLFKPHVEAAYQKVRHEYLLPPTGSADVPEPQAPSSRYLSPSPTVSSEGDSPPLPGRLTRDSDISHRDIPSQADEPQQRSGKLNNNLGARPKGIDQPIRKRPRRSSRRDSSCVHADGTPPSHGSSTGSDTTECTSKRSRSGNVRDDV